jgi:ectoine hydroxylase-related dioxygenase (phytanoyl-CoA dioxygenase family)
MYSSKQIFKDKAKQDEFDRFGYVKTPLLDPAHIKKLVNCYEKNKTEHQKVQTLHHTSTDTANIHLIIEEDALIKEAFLPALDKILVDYKALVGCLHIKEPGSGSATGMHQDPTFVDDELYISANVWVALQDIDSTNGNLFFVKGSNRVSNSLRAIPTYPVYYHSFSDKLRDMAVEVPLKAGEAIIFSNATIHGATDNKKKEPRLAATLLVCSKEAQWQIYYNDETRDKTPIERYDLDFNTFIEMPKNGRPSSVGLRERLDYVFPEISERDFCETVNGNSSVTNSIYTWISKRLEILSK